MRIDHKELIPLLSTGIVIRAGGILLIHVGNPEHVGVCISCAFTSLAGSLGLHGNDLLRYPPEASTRAWKYTSTVNG